MRESKGFERENEQQLREKKRGGDRRWRLERTVTIDGCGSVTEDERERAATRSESTRREWSREERVERSKSERRD